MNRVQFTRWISRVAKNLCIDFLRRRKHEKAILADQAMPTSSVENDYHRLSNAIKKLPLEIRLPLIMYYFDGKNAQSIAETLNISHSGACRKIRTARKELHNILIAQGDRNE